MIESEDFFCLVLTDKINLSVLTNKINLCASCLTFRLFQLGSTTSCSVLTSPNKDETGLSTLAC